MYIMYHYIHNICYYIGNNRFDLILNHITELKKINKKVLVCVSIMCDDLKVDKTKYEQIKKQKTLNIDINTFYWKNTGGTVASMWFLWKELEKQNITSDYFATWEADIVPKNKKWFDICKQSLNDGNIYVGMLTKSGYPFVKYNDEFVKKGYKYFPFYSKKIKIPSQKFYSYKQMHWTDGGFYFMKFDSLKIIENKIGCFTKANLNEKYDHTIHGIELGEVGFPTELWLNNFKFKGFESNRNWDESFVEYL